MSESHPEHGITTPGGHGAHPPQGITIPAGHGATLHFTEQQWQQFRSSDLAACKAVVLLMGGIFTVGLLLYATINILIW